MPIAGGFSDSKTVSPEEYALLLDNLAVINAHQTFLLSEDMLSNETVSITVQRQVVAGMNFLFTIKGIHESKALQIKIFRSLVHTEPVQITLVQLVD